MRRSLLLALLTFAVSCSGATGPQGAEGTTGASGPFGTEGPTGPTGTEGASGVKGPTGPGGSEGPEGASGAGGATGASGAEGPTGASGSSGPTGATSTIGPVGPIGPAGATGPAGMFTGAFTGDVTFNGNETVDGGLTVTGAASVPGLVPPGAVMAFAGSTAPAGWLRCDGSAVSRTGYAALFAAIGIAHGGGDGITTFDLPDYRGRFLRGLDEGAGRDPDVATRGAMNTGGATGDKVGSVEAEQLQSHAHGVNDPGHSHGGPGFGLFYWGCGGPLGFAGGGAYSGNGSCAGNASGLFVNGTTNGAQTGISVANAGGSETRPTNAAVDFIIRY